MAKIWGMNPPFMGGAQNVLSRQEDSRLLRNDLLQLLLTLPGERVMRPDFGTPLRGAVFEVYTDATLAQLASDIQNAILRHEQRVIVDDVVVRHDNDRQILAVRLQVRLKIEPLQDVVVETFIRTGSSGVST